MSLSNIYSIAGQAMAAQSVRLNTTASNIANADSSAKTEAEVYKSKHPIFSTVKSSVEGEMFSDAAASVKVDGIYENEAKAIMKYAPDNPNANENGYVYYPNINVVEEMADMISASRSYQTNAQMINTMKSLMTQTINLGK